MVVPFQRPQLPAVDAIARYYRRSEEARWYSNGGPCHALAAERLQRHAPEGSHVVPVASCTAGLMLALRATTLGTTATEVLIPSFTFVATASAVVWAGLTPVLVDVLEDSWMLDPDALEAALAARDPSVAAVMPGATFGAPIPTGLADRWEQACERAGVPLIIDAAAGFGGRRADGTPSGGTGIAEVFSLHATKPFAIGEGGVVCTQDAGLAARIAELANFGFDARREVVHPGINAKLSEWACATALAVDDEFDAILAARRAAAATIVAGLRDSDDLRFQELDADPTWQFVPALAPDLATRDAIVRSAAAAGVEVRTYFAPTVHQMPAFADAPRADALTVTEALSARVLSLPMANDLTAAEQQRIIEAVRSRSLA